MHVTAEPEQQQYTVSDCRGMGLSALSTQGQLNASTVNTPTQAGSTNTQCALVDNKSGGTHLGACRRSCRSLTGAEPEDDDGPGDDEHSPFFDDSGWLAHKGEGKSLQFLVPGSDGEWVCALTFFNLHASTHSCHRPGDGPIPDKMVLVEGRGQPFAVRHMQSCGSKSAAHPPISVCVNLMLDGPNHMSRGVSWVGNDQQQLLPLL